MIMHEMSIAVNIVAIAEDTARRAGAKKINAISLDLGALSGVVKDALEFCFESACKNTMAEGATLELQVIPARAVCESCGHRFEAEQMAPLCPNCGELVFQLNGGTELKVKSINVD